MVKSMGALNYSFANYAIQATSNPFIGLFIGLLTTALLQSSSTTTTIIVAAVASGNLTLCSAIPIVLGANIGTTITSTIISMSYITKQKEFGRAVAAGTVHDIFNILTAIILFPLELRYGFLESISRKIASFIHIGGSNASYQQTGFGFTNLFSGSIEFLVNLIGPILSLVIGMILLFICIKIFSTFLYKKLIGKTKDKFEQVVFGGRNRSFISGLIVTALAQSSSLTTSLIVPLVAVGKIKIRRAFQFIMGANIGTTITAILAAIFQSEAALSLALVHLLFNLIGVFLFFLTPYLSKVPLFLAKRLGKLTVKARLVGFTYIFLTFFILPFTLIYFSQNNERVSDTVEVTTDD